MNESKRHILTESTSRESARILEELPPPLPPPRPRVNTQTEMNRAYTNPESITSKKRKRNIFETVFSRHKSMQKRKTSKPAKEQPTIKAESPIVELIRSHRMSYSSPDLSKDVDTDVNHYVNGFESDLMARSSATEFSIRNEYSILDSTTASDTGEMFEDERNISENILSTYNISCNESTVNLVGANLIETGEKKPVATLIDHASGYCQMAPIIRSTTSTLSAPELPPKTPFVFSSTNQRQIPVDVTKAITFCRDYGMEASLQNFENLTISKDISQKSIKNTKNISTTTSPSDVIKPNNLTASPGTGKHNKSFDEKYPSYYPNDVPKTPLPKDQRKNGTIDQLTTQTQTTERTENLYIATPRHGANRSATKTTKSTVKSPTTTSSASQLLNTSLKSSIPYEALSNASPILFHKYATVTPVKESVSCKKSTEITSSMKRFSSLPRFKKIDFSPLKLKINSVLQRQSPDQM